MHLQAYRERESLLFWLSITKACVPTAGWKLLLHNTDQFWFYNNLSISLQIYHLTEECVDWQDEFFCNLSEIYIRLVFPIPLILLEWIIPNILHYTPNNMCAKWHDHRLDSQGMKAEQTSFHFYNIRNYNICNITREVTKSLFCMKDED